MTKISGTILNKNGDSGHLHIFPDFRGNDFSFSPFIQHKFLNSTCRFTLEQLRNYKELKIRIP
jgi:hypothetical protein